MKTLLASLLAAASVAAPVLAHAASENKTFEGTVVVNKSGTSLVVDGVTYPVDTSTFFADGVLSAVNGSTVRIKGHIGSQSVCPPATGGMMTCHAMRAILVPSTDKLGIEGNLNELYFAQPRIRPIVPHVGNMMLKTDGDKNLIVDTGSKNWISHNHQDVWLVGSLVKGGGDLATYFKASTVKEIYHPIPLIPGYMGGSPVPGANVSRNDSTNGAQQAAGTSSSQGAGVAH